MLCKHWIIPLIIGTFLNEYCPMPKAIGGPGSDFQEGHEMGLTALSLIA